MPVFVQFVPLSVDLNMPLSVAAYTWPLKLKTMEVTDISLNPLCIQLSPLFGRSGFIDPGNFRADADRDGLGRHSSTKWMIRLSCSIRRTFGRCR